MTAWICPECVAGKHGNCNGQAWDREKDEPTTCACGHTIASVIDDMEAAERPFVPIAKSNPWYPDEPGVEALAETDQEAITNLLLGRKVTKVADDHLLLDDGTVLKFIGHEGGCSCGAGDYDVTALNGVDNVITDVKFDYHPAGDFIPYESHEGDEIDPRNCPYGPSEDWKGHYRIWVYAENEKVNLMEVTGSDGNGYYGTGFGILVRRG